MSATIREIVNAALTVVGEVSGPGVQLYEDDRMKQDAVRAFNMMFKKYNWDQYLDWFTVSLDGISGKITTDAFEQVKDFEDFIAAYSADSGTPIPFKPKKENPNTGSMRGTTVMGWGSLNAANQNYKKRKLQFYPITAIGDVNVLAKVYPLVPPAFEFDWEQEFFLDKDMLVYATAYMTLSGDDLNAGAADVIRNLMEMKYKDVIASLSKHPISVAGEAARIPHYWQEYPYF